MPDDAPRPPFSPEEDAEEERVLAQLFAGFEDAVALSGRVAKEIVRIDLERTLRGEPRLPRTYKGRRLGAILALWDAYQRGAVPDEATDEEIIVMGEFVDEFRLTPLSRLPETIRAWEAANPDHPRPAQAAQEWDDKTDRLPADQDGDYLDQIADALAPESEARRRAAQAQAAKDPDWIARSEARNAYWRGVIEEAKAKLHAAVRSPQAQAGEEDPELGKDQG